MKILLLIKVVFLSLFMAYGQVSKTNTISGTVTNVTAGGEHIDRTFNFTAGDFPNCTVAGLTEVEISIRLILGNGTPPTPGAYGVHEDLNVRLVSPTGTTVDLIQDRWGYWIGMAQTNTYSGFTSVDGTMHFDDDHPTNVEPVAVNEWTTGNFSPHNPLSTFDGESPIGTWTLRISDGNGQFAANDYFHFVESTLTVTCGVACTEPSTPTVTASTNPICSGQSTTLNISGNLNDATQWHIYTGFCGVTPVGTTTGSTFTVSPTTTTSYYIRGEGGCTTPGTCGAVTVTVNPAEDASFSYSAGAYCANSTDPAPTITGLAGGSFSSTAGLSINASTGAIDVSASTPGTYTVTYTTSGACPNSTNVTVTINALDNASFNYSASAYCVNATDPTPTITGLAGGSFSSTAGLSISTSTGTIDISASTSGNYIVTYTTLGTCPNSTTFSVTIEDIVAPVADNASLTTISGQCEITSLTAPTATDNCAGIVTGTTSTSLPITASTTITWTYDDGNGNTSTQTQDVVINDVTAPVADNATLTTVTEECEITSLTPPTATDNCVGTVTGTTTAALPISVSTTITWTYDDGNGNTSTQTQDVAINDVTAPVADNATLTTVTDECEVTSLTPPTATDNCVGTVSGTTTATLPISASTTITWTYDDGNGNTSTQTQDVVIDDITAPVADNASLTTLTEECEVTSLAPPTATDNCVGTVSGTTTATLPIIASTTITWTYDDGNGNTSTQTQDVIITPIDNSATQVDPITLSADASGYDYQWVDCNNGNAPISGETAETYVATTNGSYAVIVSNGVCSDTSSCFDITTVGIKNLGSLENINVYPNPTTGYFTIDLGSLYDEITLRVVDNIGRTVVTDKFISTDKIYFTFNAKPGMYLLQGETKNGKSFTTNLIIK